MRDPAQTGHFGRQGDAVTGPVAFQKSAECYRHPSAQRKTAPASCQGPFLRLAPAYFDESKDVALCWSSNVGAPLGASAGTSAGGASAGTSTGGAGSTTVLLGEAEEPGTAEGASGEAALVAAISA
jgi:hypothetical protein